MGLSLIAGPASAGKVALLLERYLAALAREPVLIVPNRSDVERVERDLLARSGALLGGSIGTFDDVFERVARTGFIPITRFGEISCKRCCANRCLCPGSRLVRGPFFKSKER